MSSSNIKSFEREAFKIKLSKLSENKAVDNSDFADIVYTAMSQFGIDENQFRDAFGLTKGAVDRWTQQLNLPQPTVRIKIINWIRAQL